MSNLPHKSLIPRYVVVMQLANKRELILEWRVKKRGTMVAHGNPSGLHLAAYCQRYNESLLPAGRNAHLGWNAHCVAAIVRENHRGAKTLASWKVKE